MSFSFALMLLKLKKLPWIKILVVLVPIIIVAVTLFLVYDAGRDSGRSEVQSKWNAEKLVHGKAIAKLQDELRKKEAENASESRRIGNELKLVREDYEAKFAALDADYSKRLSDSASRGDRYRSLAEAGPAQCRSVASRAAQLDTSLEQGRRVVEELRSTLEQRDSQLRLLGLQLQNDRGLLGTQNELSNR